MEIIHIVLGKANPERMNGVNKVVYQLATWQSASGRKVSVWGITKSNERNFGDRNFETHLFEAHRNPFRVDQKLKTALTNMKGKAVFHLHGGWIPVFATISRILSINEIPFVFTPHGAYNTIAMERSNILKKIYFNLFERSLLKRATKIHCIGESEVSGLNGIFRTDKTFLLPYGFEIASTGSLKRIIHDKQFIIGFVGRLDIYTKGLDILLDAFAGRKKFFNNATIWIVGDSDERSELNQMIISRHLHNNVVMWGSKFGAEKEHLMRQMDVFVHPSRNEGLPSAVLEASAMGIPSVVSTATNVGHYIQEYNSGRVIPNEDPDALAKALEELYDKKKEGELEVIGRNGRKMVEEAFSWDRIVLEFDHMYKAS